MKYCEKEREEQTSQRSTITMLMTRLKRGSNRIYWFVRSEHAGPQASAAQEGRSPNQRSGVTEGHAARTLLQRLADDRCASLRHQRQVVYVTSDRLCASPATGCVQRHESVFGHEDFGQGKATEDVDVIPFHGTCRNSSLQESGLVLATCCMRGEGTARIQHVRCAVWLHGLLREMFAPNELAALRSKTT
ncbi:hypothetical protein C0Q70_06989 [Pomacea canaliculata]|uniref:Uncharacterized protein n=1 Tax=Pomacea canaliculata TaxID=400727 RepID=A0A2T7PDS4_POMCA|nr:hypothetical protein C0Q70_06989 [Pomacea canaliculata]